MVFGSATAHQSINLHMFADFLCISYLCLRFNTCAITSSSSNNGIGHSSCSSELFVARDLLIVMLYSNGAQPVAARPHAAVRPQVVHR